MRFAWLHGRVAILKELVHGEVGRRRPKGWPRVGRNTAGAHLILNKHVQPLFRNAPPPEVKLWRYLSFAKLVSLLYAPRLHHPRCFQRSLLWKTRDAELTKLHAKIGQLVGQSWREEKAAPQTGKFPTERPPDPENESPCTLGTANGGFDEQRHATATPLQAIRQK